MAPRYGELTYDQTPEAQARRAKYNEEHPEYTHQEALHLHVQFRLTELINLIGREDANKIHQAYYEGKNLADMSEADQVEYLADHVRAHTVIIEKEEKKLTRLELAIRHFGMEYCGDTFFEVVNAYEECDRETETADALRMASNIIVLG